MGKQLQDGREFFDGEVVEIYEGRFSGTFIMPEESGAPLSNDDLVTFIVTARVEAPKFSYIKKSGDLKRSNTMRVQFAALVDAAEAKYIYDNYGEDVNGVNQGMIEVPMDATPQETEQLFDDWNVNG